MINIDNIRIKKNPHSRIAELSFDDIPFGKVFSDHMFKAEYREGAWDDMCIVPYGNLSITPANPAIHYGQSIFEGMKAHKGENGEIFVFRPLEHWERMNASARRMCMPELPKEIFMEGLMELLNIDKDWVPTTAGGSLYIRPFMFSRSECIGVRPSKKFTFMIITCPVGAYYRTPLKVCIELEYTRASAGGIGYVKTGGNYSGALYPTKLARDKGYHQVIWTDDKEHRYIEESSTMNIMFMIRNTLVTSVLNGSILKGITRDSILQLARHWNMEVEERNISVEELIDGLESGIVTEAFGVGTAVTITHIELIGHRGKDHYLPPVTQRPFSNSVFKELNGIKTGAKADPFGWVYQV